MGAAGRGLNRGTSLLQANGARSGTEMVGDWSPFLKTLARKVHPIWRTVAEKLCFSAEDCEEFEKALPSCSWWASYKMLSAWSQRCQTDTTAQFKQKLSDIIRPFDAKVADEVLSITVA